jgi:hypothetical protein
VITWIDEQYAEAIPVDDLASLMDLLETELVPV